MESLHRTVEVTLIDDADGECIGVTQLPPENLPESFEISTTLHLGDVDWSVVEATPQTRAEYSTSGSLTLRLRRMERIDPREILFSLPTICDAIPNPSGHPLAGNEFLLHEDHWRQLELVSRKFAPQVDQEIEAIRRIHQECSEAVGWREIHVRREPIAPIAAGLTLDHISRAFGAKLEFTGIAFLGGNSPLSGGYSFTSPDGQVCYGLTYDGMVEVLAVAQKSIDPLPERTIRALAVLSQEFDLDLVHWSRCARVGSDNPMFQELLIANAKP